MSDKENAIKAVTKTIYNQSRGEGEKGMKAVGDTIHNRMQANKGYTGGNDPTQVCRKGYQGYKGNDPNPKNPIDQKAYDYSKSLATDIVNKQYKPDIASTHFDATRNSFKKYEEKGGFNYDQQIGKHFFFTEKNLTKNK